MTQAHERVRAAVTQVIALLSGKHRQPGEAVVRQTIVLRLLQAAGWDIWNPDEVSPEETNLGGKRPDFLVGLRPDAFALELKGMNATMGHSEAHQAVSYAGSVGVRWAVLTNGRIWTIYDESLPGAYHEREVLRLEITLGDPEPFAQDFAEVLSADTWRAGRFSETLARVQQHQHERQQQQVLREKLPEVKAFQQEFEIGSLKKAIELYARQGQITEAERDILLGGQASPGLQPALQPERSRVSEALPKPLLVPELKPETWGKTVEFYCRVLRASARVRYDISAGTWTVLAGSTALDRQPGKGSDIAGILKRREALISRGDMKRQGDGLLIFVRDVVYSSPSTPADDIAAASRNGWDVWKDAEGRSAQHYRPSKS